MTSLKTGTQPATSDVSPTVTKSLRQPAWHVVLLSMFTFLTYLFYWLYKTTRDLKSIAGASTEPTASAGVAEAVTETSAGANAAKPAEVTPTVAVVPAEPLLSPFRKINPFWFTVAAIAPTAVGPLFLIPMGQEAMQKLTPIVGILTLGFFVYIFHAIAKLGRDGSMLKNNPTFPAFCLMMAMVALYRLGKLPGHFYLLFTLTSIPVAIAQHWLNDYLERKEPSGALLRHSFSMGEIITMLVGSSAVTWVLLANI